MAKRFTDSRKWDDDFLISIEPKYKLLWVYMLDKCDHAGIYKQSSALEKCCLSFEYDWQDVEKVFNGRIIRLKDQKYLVPRYVEFQYGELNPNNRVHASVIEILKKEGAYKGLIRGMQGGKDKDMDKDKDNINNNLDTDKDNCSSVHDKDKKIGDKFNEFWDAYPRKVGMSMAFKTFSATIKTDKDFQDLMTALKNYMASKDVKGGYIKNGDNWLEDWRGWINVKTEIRWKKP